MDNESKETQKYLESGIEFSRELGQLIEKYNEVVPIIKLIDIMILTSKIHLCGCFNDFEEMKSILFKMNNHHLLELWENINAIKEKN